MQAIITRVEKIFIFFLIYSLVFFLFFSTLSYTLPFVLAISFSLLLKKPTKLLVSKFSFKPWLASLFSSIIFFIILLSFIFFSAMAIVNETISLTSFIPNYITKLSGDIYTYIMELSTLFPTYFDKAFIDSIQSTLADAAATLIKSTLNFSAIIIPKIISIISSIPYIAMVIIFTLISTYYLTLRVISPSSNSIEKYAPKTGKKFLEVSLQMRKMVGNYALSYLLIVFITFLFTFIGFLILDIKYAFLLSLLCAIFDLLPVVGMPLIYIPLSVFYFTKDSYFTAVALIILCIFIFIARQIIEPKIMSTTLGLNPVAVLAAIFIGLQVNGVIGMLFCMFLVVFYTVLKELRVI